MREKSSNYLPVYEGMPRFEESSPPATLTSTSAVEAFLAGTPFECRSVTQFTGGNINYVYRLHLATPIGDIKTVVLKHAQPFFRVCEEVVWELDRQAFEVEAMTRVRKGLPATSTVTVPEIFHFDAKNHFIILEDCGSDVATLKELIISGSLSSTAAETIGSAVGEFIATLHEWSRSNPDGILDVFDECPHTRKMVASGAYDHVVSTLQGTDEDNLPLLSGFEIDSSKLQTIQTLADEYRAHLMSPGHSTHDVFLMGDLTYTNVLVSNDDKQPLRIYLLDWELARTGLPGSEFGMFCAFLSPLTRGDSKAAGLASTVQKSFFNSYSRHAKLNSRLAQDALAHWGANYIYWMPREPLCEEKEVVDFVKEGVEYMARSRDVEFLAQSPVQVLLGDERYI
ncbi:kinase-like domain-containing protein [Crepidotus variabilis]|uniref:Kinase-like domain-containing protein n=1 Tax=Crepidotus variabilis TaxID=179855 RepID=A0A9P6JMX2_9AGAR|nr:kinase-like domain-containing protein [Crepidotus variabilis]